MNINLADDGVPLIQKYFELTPSQTQKFQALDELYRDWNSKINVISRKDVDNLYLHHILHSLSIAKIVSFRAGAKILDVGTGGGFPGIPLAILFPESAFHLADSIGKKITVVKAVAEALHLDNVSGMNIRAEQLKEKYDFVVSRAVTQMKEFYGWVHHKIKDTSVHALDNGILYLKGGAIEEEMDALRKPYAVYNLPDFFEESFFETKKIIFMPVQKL